MAGLIDTRVGMEYCMDDEEFYNEMLETYLEDSAEVVEGMRKAYEDSDIGLYATKVHALKSTSKTIGAVGLSELALELEMAAKASDIEQLRQKADGCLELYGKVVEEVRLLLADRRRER